MEGIFIPKEFYKDTELKGLERDVLALYKYYTENGNNKCCSLNSVQIAEYFNVSSRYIKSIRKHLKELGYIRTDGGIKVIYVGVKGEVQLPQKGTTVPPGVSHSSPQKGTTVPPKGEPQFPHKKEKKDTKEIKKEEKRDMTNLDLLLDRLPEEYKTPEIIEFINTNYLDKINQADLSDGSILDTYVVRLKSELLKRFIVYPVIDKPTPIRKTDEDDFMF